MYLGLCKGHDNRTARARACLKEAMSHLLTLKGESNGNNQTKEGNMQYFPILGSLLRGAEDAFTEARRHV